MHELLRRALINIKYKRPNMTLWLSLLFLSGLRRRIQTMIGKIKMAPRIAALKPGKKELRGSTAHIRLGQRKGVWGL